MTLDTAWCACLVVKGGESRTVTYLSLAAAQGVGSPELKRRERELLAGRVGTLMAFQYFVPDNFQPSEELEQKTAQQATQQAGQTAGGS